MSWNQDELRKELTAITQHKPPVSKSKVQSITKIANDNAAFAQQVAEDISHFILRVPAPYRLSGFYLIDSICKKNEAYQLPFAKTLEASTRAVLEASDKDLESVKKVVGIWGKHKIFPTETLQHIAFLIQEKTGSAPDGITPVAPAPASAAPMIPGALQNLQNLLAGIPGFTAAASTTPLSASSSSASGSAPYGMPPANAQQMLLAALMGAQQPQAHGQQPSSVAAPSSFDYGDDEDDLDDGTRLARQKARREFEEKMRKDEEERKRVVAEEERQRRESALGAAGSSLQRSGSPQPLSNYQQQPHHQLGSVPGQQQQQYFQNQNFNGGPQQSHQGYSASAGGPPPQRYNGSPSNAHANVVPGSIPYPPQSNLPVPGQNQQPLPRHSQMYPFPPPPHLAHNNSNPQGHPPQHVFRPPFPPGGAPPGFPQQQHQKPPHQQMPMMQQRVDTNETDPSVPVGHKRVWSHTLFVGNLSPSVAEEHLVTEFRSVGNLMAVKYMPEKHMCFVTYVDRKDAETARETYHEQSLGGRPMKVGWAKGFGEQHEVFDFELGTSVVPLNAIPKFRPNPKNMIPKQAKPPGFHVPEAAGYGGGGGNYRQGGGYDGNDGRPKRKFDGGPDFSQDKRAKYDDSVIIPLAVQKIESWDGGDGGGSGGGGGGMGRGRGSFRGGRGGGMGMGNRIQQVGDYDRPHKGGYDEYEQSGHFM